MKSLLKSAFEWMNHKLAKEEVQHEDHHGEVIQFTPVSGGAAALAINTPVLPGTPNVARPVGREPAVTRRTYYEAPAPVVAKVEIPAVLYSGGPEMIVVVRGKNMYGTCPECSSTWNLRERLVRHSRSDKSKPLTCPSCDHAVCLPVSVDLLKLS